MSSRLVGLIPAAGRSERMGRPKLTLGLGQRSLIQAVVEALAQGGADEVLVVAPPVRREGAVVLANHARVEGAHVVHCEDDTPDMRRTIEVGLAAMVDHVLAPDAILLTPGDCPGLTPALVARVVAQARREPDRIVVPVYQGHRGHPVAIPWTLAVHIPELPPGLGVNALLDLHAGKVLGVPVDDPGTAFDIDTPDDLRQWLDRRASG